MLMCFSFFLGVEPAENTSVDQELCDESGDGLERLGPHTDSNIMKNVTVLSSDSTTGF